MKAKGTKEADHIMDLRGLLAELWEDESGQDVIEYALIALVIALGATATMRTLATTIGTAFAALDAKLNSAI
jgi:pilus assembly protein Flp/PilA